MSSVKRASEKKQYISVIRCVFGYGTSALYTKGLTRDYYSNIKCMSCKYCYYTGYVNIVNILLQQFNLHGPKDHAVLSSSYVVHLLLKRTTRLTVLMLYSHELFSIIY